MTVEHLAGANGRTRCGQLDNTRLHVTTRERRVSCESCLRSMEAERRKAKVRRVRGSAPERDPLLALVEPHRWTDSDGQAWECDEYDHGPFCRLCRRVAGSAETP
jgi:hypothetical protein